MKNTIKLPAILIAAGIIVFAMIIGFSVSACDLFDDEDDGNDGIPDPIRWSNASIGTIFGSATSGSTTYDNSVYAVVFGGGRFVAAGDNGKMAHSTDGISWTAVDNSTFGDSTIYALAYGNNRFVAVGMHGKMAYSTNGTTWTAVSNSTFDYAILDIVYGGNRFVAIGGGRQIARSSDGITWTSSGTTTFAGGYAGLSCIAFGNSRYVVGRSNITCAQCDPYSGHSTDGLTWTGATNNVFASRNSINDITYGDNKFIAVGGISSGASPGSGKSTIGQSSNGSSWTEVTPNNVRSVFGHEPINTVAYGGGYFVATGGEMGDDQSPFKGIGYSTNGTTWTAINSNAFTDNDRVIRIAYGNGRFVMVGDSYNRLNNSSLRNWFGKIWYSGTVE